jgi:hypothetical protein
MEPFAFYARWKVRLKSSRSCMERRSRAPCFLYATMRVLEVIEAERYVDREPLAFTVVLVHWSFVCSCVSPLRRSGQACDQVECH